MAQVRKGKNAGDVKIKLVKSLIGRNDKHIATAHSLGLHKIGTEVVCAENDALRGKLAQISYLIETDRK
ncbi:MAG: 50S ribosomal protein L30 [Oscillospiraceae bacterium]|nr:50S ribosomal protein L30 [Oscillospiraceae bacterium]